MGLKAYLSVSYRADQLAVAYVQAELLNMGVEVVRYRTTRTSHSTSGWDNEDTEILQSCNFMVVIPPAVPKNHIFYGETFIGAGQSQEIDNFKLWSEIYVTTTITTDNLSNIGICPLVSKNFVGTNYHDRASVLSFDMHKSALTISDMINIEMAQFDSKAPKKEVYTSDLDQALAELRSIGQVSYEKVPKFRQAPTRSDMPELDEALSVLRREAPEIAAQAEKEYRIAATAIKDIDSEDFFTLEDTSLLSAAPPVLLKY